MNSFVFHIQRKLEIARQLKEIYQIDLSGIELRRNDFKFEGQVSCALQHTMHKLGSEHFM